MSRKKKKKSRKKKETEYEQYDILQLDEKIKKLIIEESKNVDKYKMRIDELTCFLNDDLSYKQKKMYNIEKENLKQKIHDIETNNIFAEYVCISQKIITEYMELLSVPVNISFFGKKTVDEKETKKDDLLDKFLDIAKKYIPVKTYKKETKQKVLCECGNYSDFTYTENTVTCEVCGLEDKIYTIQTNFKDIDRVNLSQKYKYSKRVYFRDTINRYEGKQNKNIDRCVYDDIENWFQKHNLLKNVESWHVKHSNITKDHLYMALSETNHNLHYEDINLLFSHFTGVTCPDISNVRDKLIEDFDKVMAVYETLEVDRVNSLNSQYILYQLLRKHKVKVNVGDFGMLKTRDRLIEYDEIYSKICEILEFSFHPTI